ncbi:MAG: TonB-dependent receptor [Candidatus Adiutrix sp.]|nr:TonB-dependent receptor [Candidatus Adiutrix sp.]
MKRNLMVLAAAVLLAPPASAWAQNAQNGSEEEAVTVNLEAAELVETKTTMEVLTQEDMARKTATNLWEALKGEPGLWLENSGGTNQRNEQFIGIRGLDQNRIKIVLDGLPVSTNWRGEYDLGRFSIWDIETVEISKGYSSTLIPGYRGLGGVINMRSARPTKELDFKAMYRHYFDRKFGDQGYEYGASVGTRQEKFFLKASYQAISQDYWMLPSGVTTPQSDRDGKLPDLYNEDSQINLMAGWTPTEDTELMVGYFKHEAEKGSYYSTANQTGYWPQWDTERLYSTFTAKPTDNSYLKANAYYEEHKDTVYRFINGVVPPWGPNPSPSSDYSWPKKFDDAAYGGQLEYGYTFNERHKAAVSLSYRKEEHDEKLAFDGSPWRKSEVSYYELGGEYTYKPIDPLSLVFGAAYREQHTDAVSTYIYSNANPGGQWDHATKKPTYDAFDYQFGAFYDLTDEHEIHFTYAHKTSFAPQRTLYNWDNTLSNAGLFPPTWIKPEEADHFEIGYKGDISGRLELSGAVFYTKVRNLIGTYNVMVNNAPYATNGNVGRVDYSGVELGLKAVASEYLTFGGSVSHLLSKRKSVYSGDADMVSLRPEWTMYLYAEISPIEDLKIIPSLYASAKGVFIDRTDNYAQRVAYGGYSTVDLKALYNLTENFTLEVGAQNLFDKKYTGTSTITGNSRETWRPGRSFYAGLQISY